MDFDVVVLGAGAAGMMCAATAGRRGRRVLLVDHATRLAEKIRISGGGRCNFTNLHCAPQAFLSRNPHFCRSALARYTPRDFIALVERHGIGYHEKTLGQLFCDDSSQRIIDMLRHECDQTDVRWAMPASVAQVTRQGGDGPVRFEVATSRGTFRCAALVVATGGLSVAKIGASPLGYRIAEQFGLAVVPPRPALVPLAAAPQWLARYGVLSGTSFEAATTCPDTPRPAHFREAVLLTHRGLSGPAILQVSSYWQAAGGRGEIEIDLLPGEDAAAWLARHRHDGTPLPALLARRLPRRFAQAWAQEHDWIQPLAEMPKRTLEATAAALARWRVRPSGTLGFDKAEVTLGGVDTGGLQQQSLEARAVPGLYFVGEVVDVTGWLGGYNFQWAWASGYAAGMAV